MIGTNPIVNHPFEKTLISKNPATVTAEGPDKAGNSPFKTREAVKHNLYQKVARPLGCCGEPLGGGAQALWI
jgi:hypothetical protein